MLTTEILNQITLIARLVSPRAINAICHQLEKTSLLKADFAGTGIEDVPDFTSRDLFLVLFKLCTKQSDVPPCCIAAALKAAVAMGVWVKQNQKLEVVWTGPSQEQMLFRRTDQALLDVISFSRKNLIIVTFTAYKIKEVSEALVHAAHRGVNISIIIEDPEESSGSLTFTALRALGKSVLEKSSVYYWPKEKRILSPNGQTGSLHAKCAVADNRFLLISSANLTEHAMNINMELGIIIRGGSEPELIQRHFELLIEQNVLQQVEPYIGG